MAFENIAVILDKYNGASVSKVNSRNKLPIDLLWESDYIIDNKSKAYVDTMFRLLRAYPESLRRNINANIFCVALNYKQDEI